MLVFEHTNDISTYLWQQKLSQKKIGFVPTMGALHAGHVSLLKQSLKENDITVCSIFVNPLQFNNSADFEKYPITWESDIDQLKNVGCQVVFHPQRSDIYPSQPILSLSFGILENSMEGAFRPGHFNGVGIVVARLFHIIQPDVAYFGQKDLQQLAIVRQLVQDLAFPIAVIRCVTLRDADGLALSSRNARLLPADRKLAPLIYQALCIGAQIVVETKNVSLAIESIRECISQQVALKCEYVEAVHPDTLAKTVEYISGTEIAFCTAVWLGGVRLIDNSIVKLP